MTFWSSLNIIVGLIAVLATMGLLLQIIKKYSNRFTGSKESAPMEILHRISLTPRQGLAVIRIGIRYFAVAIGEGGVQLLAELATNDLTNIKQTPSTSLPPTTVFPDRGDKSSGTNKSVPQVTPLASRRPAIKLSTTNRASTPESSDVVKNVSNNISRISSVISRKSPGQNRVSYIAPIDDFKAVLSMAMNGTDR